MKDDRNCGNYPVYPTMYGGAMPGPLPINGVNMPMPMPIGMPNETYGNFNYGSDSSLASQLNSLEQRVTKLENMINSSSYSSNSYNTTNYQMM